MFCPILSCPVLYCPVLFCPILSCIVLSCPVLSCIVLSCPVLSCPVLSFYSALFSLVSFHLISYCIKSYYIMLNCLILLYIVLAHIVLSNLLLYHNFLHCLIQFNLLSIQTYAECNFILYIILKELSCYPANYLLLGIRIGLLFPLEFPFYYFQFYLSHSSLRSLSSFPFYSRRSNSDSTHPTQSFLCYNFLSFLSPIISTKYDLPLFKII